MSRSEEPAHPLVHVVVVDHNGGAVTLACLRSLATTDWPADRLRIVLVDNASVHPLALRAKAELPDVEIVTSTENLGFAGGANLGLRRRGDADYVGIVNNDVTVERGWLAPLVRALAEDGTLGAACPKILLAAPAHEVVLEAPTSRRGRGDHRDLGVRVSGARIDGIDVWSRTRLVGGFWGPEPMSRAEAGAQWTAERAVLRVPIPAESVPDQIELRLAADSEVSVIAASGSTTTTCAVGRTPVWYAVTIGDTPTDVINNVGTIVAEDGYGSDRGWLEVDRGQYDEPADVDAWCGAAVLLPRAYLDDVGDFDERLFLYYEDIELSLRGTRRGWRYRTIPSSVVRHVHAATSIEGSALKDHYNERNRLIVATQYAPAGRILRIVLRYLLTTVSYLRRDVVAPSLRGQRARPFLVARRGKAFASYLALVPSALRVRQRNRN